MYQLPWGVGQSQLADAHIARDLFLLVLVFIVLMRRERPAQIWGGNKPTSNTVPSLIGNRVCCSRESVIGNHTAVGSVEVSHADFRQGDIVAGQCAGNRTKPCRQSPKLESFLFPRSATYYQTDYPAHVTESKSAKRAVCEQKKGRGNDKVRGNSQWVFI